MKFSLITLLCVCAFAHATVNFEQKLPIVRSVSAAFQNNHLALNFLARENELTAEDKLLITQLISYGSRNAISGIIQDALEDFRDTIFNGNENIPVLDPLLISELGPYEYIITGVRARGTIHDFRMEGLGWYIVDEVTFNVLRLALGVRLTVPRLTFTGRYEAQAFILFATYRASGNYRVIINQVGIDVNARMGLSGANLLLRELDVKINIQDMHINIEGMTGSSIINNFINAFINSITEEVVQNQLENISQILSAELFDIINEILKDLNINDILG